MLAAPSAESHSSAPVTFLGGEWLDTVLPRRRWWTSLFYMTIFKFHTGSVWIVLIPSASLISKQYKDFRSHFINCLAKVVKYSNVLARYKCVSSDKLH